MFNKLKSPFYLGALIFVGLLFFIPHTDTDFGWHLRYGEYFLQTGKLMKANTLTYYLNGYLWPNSYTLYQIIISIIYRSLGFLGISLANSILLILTFVFYDAVNPKSTRFNLLSFIVIILFGRSVFISGFRAQEFTFFFLVLTYYLVYKFSKKKYLPLLTAPVFMLWANMHGGFILGQFLIFAALVNAIVNKIKKETLILGLSLVFSILASLINPYGIKIFEEAIRHMQVPMGTLIAEWVAPTAIYKIAIVISALVLLIQLWKTKSKNRFFWTISIAGFSYISYFAKRNLPFFAWNISLSAGHYKLEKFEDHPLFKTITNIFLISGVSLLLFINTPKTLESAGNPDYLCTKGMLPNPCKAVAFIKENAIPGYKVFSSYEWGGYLAWKLPEYRFFVDGRTPAWPTPEGKSPYTVYLEIIQARNGYQKSLEKYGTDWMLVPANTFLDLELQENTTFWKEIYRDEISVVYVKK